MMKKILSAVAGACNRAKNVSACVIVMAALAACSGEEPERASASVSVSLNGVPVEDTVTVTFGFGYDMAQMARASTRGDLSAAVSRLDLWIYDGQELAAEVHQSSSDEGFGSVSATLDKRKTYTLYAVAHKADGAATLTDGIVSFPDDKVKDTFWYTTTFSPADATTVACELERIVAGFRLSITDGIPAEVKRLRITMGGVYDRWSVTDGAAHQTDRVVTVNYGGTSANFLVYAIVPEAETLHTVTVEALDANDVVVQQRTFPDVPLRRNFKTQFTGDFFTSQPMAITLSAASDWQEYAPVAF